MPSLATRVSFPPPCRPLVRRLPPDQRTDLPDTKTTCTDVAVNTDVTGNDLELLGGELAAPKEKLQQSKLQQSKLLGNDLREQQLFRLKYIGDDDAKVRFYTGFLSLSALMACFRFLGPSVNT